MHEIVGTILYCVERELDAWKAPNLKQRSLLVGVFTEDTVEAHTYWLFTGCDRGVKLIGTWVIRTY